MALGQGNTSSQNARTLVYTLPQGLEGLFTRIALVRLSIKLSRWSKSASQPRSGWQHTRARTRTRGLPQRHQATRAHARRHTHARTHQQSVRTVLRTNALRDGFVQSEARAGPHEVVACANGGRRTA